MLSVCKIIFSMVPIFCIVFTNIYLFGLFVISNYSKGREPLDFGVAIYIAIMGVSRNFPTSGRVHRGEYIKF